MKTYNIPDTGKLVQHKHKTLNVRGQHISDSANEQFWDMRTRPNRIVLVPEPITMANN
jgi:hypothetical protein